MEKCTKDVEAAKEKYEAALSDLNAYNPKYMEEMMEVFQRSQDAEEKRLRFFKEVFLSLYRTLDISANEKYDLEFVRKCYHKTLSHCCTVL